MRGRSPSLYHSRQCGIVIKLHLDCPGYTVVCFMTHDCSENCENGSSQAKCGLIKNPSYRFVLLEPGECTTQVVGGGSSVLACQLLGTLCDTSSSSHAVYGMAVLRDELFVARDRSNVVQVFDVTSLFCHRRFAVILTSMPQQVLCSLR